jgi:hypothetical protein
MDFTNYSIDLTKIQEQIQRELAQRQIERAIVEQMQSFPGTTLARIEAVTQAWLGKLPPPQSEQDAAACRAIRFARPVSDGRPQFFVPDLGE